MIAERFPELALLPDEDKLTLMAELWQDVTDDAADESPELTAFVQQRLQEYRDHPERVSPWSQVKARILASRA
jgi:putative addiction module component (TIGR02574 family)